jgi:hypothetical protein
VIRHARALRGDHAAAELAAGASGSVGRTLSAMLDTQWADEPACPFPLPAQAWLPATGVLVARSRAGTPAGLFLAAKAGHNAESHNHNDVGSFVVALDGRPLIIDVGVGIYTRQTFGPDRYAIWTMQSSWHNVPEVDAVPQAAGRQYASRLVWGVLNPGAAELSADIAGTYPPEAGIRSWHRTIRLDREASAGGKIIIDDAWTINHVPARTALYLITARQPHPAAAAGRLVIPASGTLSGDTGPDGDTGLAVDYPHAGFDARIEERPVDDPRLAATWGHSIYRITLAARRPASEGYAHIEISAATAPIT